MKIELNLNPDEALALIQICEHDIFFPEVARYVIDACERHRHEWAREQRERQERTNIYVLDGHNNLIDITPHVLQENDNA